MNSASVTNNDPLNNNTNGDQIQWPTLYSAIENMSLDERRMQKQQQRSQQIRNSISMQNNNNQFEQEPRSTSSASVRYASNSLRSKGHGNTSYHQQNNNFYRQTSVTPRILNLSNADDQRAMQSPSTYFGSGSTVGRGRPMTGDR